MAPTRYIALLRGINVGGNNPIKMVDLRECLTAAGFANVRTYIASGNVLLTSTYGLAKTEKMIDVALEKRFNYRGPTVVLSATNFAAIVSEAPAGFGATPDRLHSDVIFLKAPANPKHVLNNVLTLRIKEGVDTAAAGSMALYFTRVSAERTKSRMNKIMELPVYKQMTVRSWNTTIKLRELLATE